MSVSQDKKSELIKKHAQNDKDKGSTNIQVAVLSNRISNLTEHLKKIRKIKVHEEAC